MRRRVLLAALAVAATVTAASSAAGTGIQLTEARASFPNRAFVISLPTNRALSASDVQVSENGNAVIDVTVAPASAVGRTTFGVVVVVDASDSMAGKPIQSAMAAARVFVARRNANQQLALLTFNNNSKVALPFTTSPARINAALAQVPSVAYGTHIYDAVAKAEEMLATAKIQAGSILLLSDGADTGSLNTGSAVAEVARRDHVKLFTIGLRSLHFDPSTLESLAAGGGGSYALARSTAELAPLFDQLGGRLAQEYLLSYKSLAGPKVHVHVNVAVTGAGAAASDYQTPALAVPKVAAYHRSMLTRLWTSPVVMVLLALLIATGIALVGIGLLEPRSGQLPGRMAEFVSVPGLQTRARKGALSSTPGGETNPDAEPPGFWQRFDQALEIAKIPISGAGLVGWTIVGTVVAYLLVDLAVGSPWWALFALLVPVAVREWATRTLAHRRNQFSEQLPDALQVISSALRSGHSLAGALAVVVEAGEEPMKSEMQRVVADEQLGVPLGDALAVAAKRMASRDLEQVGLVAELQEEAGSNAAEVVDRVAETIRERFELRRLVKTLTVQGRMSRWIVSALPVVIILVLQAINPHYLHPLFAHTGGRILFGVAAAFCVAGSIVIGKIVDIKV